MEISVRVQKPVKQEKIVWFHAKQDKDLRECLHCGYFYGAAAGALHSIVQRKWQDYRNRWIKTVHVMAVLIKNRKVTVFHV